MDVLVAGAGPVGLFAAHSLARNGVSVGVVDTGIWACSHSYALALHPGTVDLLGKAGLAEDIVDAAHPIRRVGFYDNKTKRASLALDSGRPMLVLPQSALEAGLEKALGDAGVQVKWKHKVAAIEPAGDRVRVTLHRYEKESRGYVIARTEWAITKTWTIEVPWVIGADGYNSGVRHSLEIGFPETGPARYYAVFEFESDADSADEVRIICGPETTDVLWPLGDGWFRWSFELPEYVDPEVQRFAEYRARYGDPSDRAKDRSYHTSGDVQVLPDERLNELISSRGQWFKGSIGEIGWRTIVRFESRLAEAFGSGRCWLAGDAAHIGYPLGVQSLNAGIAEAHDLSEAIASAVRYEPEPSWFNAYNARHQNDWKALQIPLEALKDVDPWVWENRDRLLPCLPGHGDKLTALAAQLGLRSASLAGASQRGD